MKRILHIEDEKRVTDLVGLALKKEYDYTAVQTREEAMALINSQKFDLIILDLKLLPEKKITGDFEGEKIIKELTGNKTPIIILSALSETSRQVKKKYSNIKGIVKKPFRIKTELKSMIKKVLKEGKR